MKINILLISFFIALGSQADEYLSFCEAKDIRVEFFDNGDNSLIKGPKFLNNGTHIDDYALVYFGGESQTGDIQQLPLLGIGEVLDKKGNEIFQISFKGANGYFLSAIFDRSGKKNMLSLIPKNVSFGMVKSSGEVEYIQKETACLNYKSVNSTLQNKIDPRVANLFSNYLKSMNADLKDVKYKIQELKVQNLDSTSTRTYVVYYQWKMGDLSYDTFYVLFIHGLSTNEIWRPYQLTPYLEQKIVEQTPAGF